MDFKSFLGKAAKVGMDVVQTTAEQAQAKMQRVERYKAQFESLDDRELIRKYKTTSGEQKMACAMLLKERGYGNSSDN